MRILPVLLLFLSLMAAFAQPKTDGSIRGLVIDSASRQPMMQANVALFSARDSAFLSLTVTGGEGNFLFRNLKEGAYRVLITHVGYRNISRLVSISPAAPGADLGTMDMAPAPLSLDEVVISQERAPVEIKGDTLEFNAGSFSTRPHAQVEDLLKKLPGVEISRDGTIRAQGQEVQRVLVDGKPFFGDDPKVATRNLPADIIDKIQLYDQQSDQSAFSGFDDGNREKTINLVTRKDRRKGTFGQNTLGAGTQNRYQGRLSLNRFNDEQQFSLLAMGNNVNQQGFTLQDMFNFGAGASGGQGGNTAGGPGSSSSPGGGGPVMVVPGQGGGNRGANAAGGQPDNITEVWAGGANFRDSWGKKLEVNGSYFLNRSDVRTEQHTFRQNVLPDTAFLQDGTNQSRTRNLNHRLNLRIDYRLDSLNSFRLMPNLSVQQSDYTGQNSSRTFTGSGLPLNSSLTDNTSAGDGIYGTNTFLYMRRFRRRGRSFSLNLNSVFNGQNSLATNRSENEFYGEEPETPLFRSFNQQSRQQTRRLSHTLTLSYTEPLSLRRSLEVRYWYGQEDNNSRRTVNDFDEQSGRYDRINAPLSNQFDNAFTFQRAGLGIQTRRLKYTYTLGLDVQAAELRADNLSGENQLSRRFTNVLPNALLTYNFTGSRTLRVSYRTRINAPTVTQLQPVADNTNPLNIRLGNPELQPEYLSQVTAIYNAFNSTTFGSVFALLNLSHTNNRIANAVTVGSNGAQITQPVNTDGNYVASGFLALGRPIRPIKSNLNLTTNLNYSRGVNLVNDQPNYAHSLTVGQGLRLNSNWGEHLEISLSSNLNYQRAVYSLQPGQNTSFFFQTLGMDAFYRLPFGMMVTGDFTYTAATGRSAGFNQTVALLNLGLARPLFKSRQGELRFTAYDLLNQNQSIARNVGDTYLEDVRSRLLRRYFLLSLTYNLRQFGGRKSVSSEQ
jgi:hypothetical protein